MSSRQIRRRNFEYDDDISWDEIGTLSNIPPHISESIQWQARQIFLHHSVVLTPDSRSMSQGHFANLASVLGSSKSRALDSALSAVALLLLATRFGMYEARSLALAQYTASIRHLRGQDLVSGANAQCLLASISLLGLYEVRIQDCFEFDDLECRIRESC
jgi:hypothetical protein